MPSKGKHKVINVHSTESEPESSNNTDGQHATTSSVKRKHEEPEDRSGSEEDDSTEVEFDSPQGGRIKQEAKQTRWPWISQCMSWL